MISKAQRIGRVLSVLFVVVALAALTATPAVAKTMSDIKKAGVFNLGVVPFSTDVIKDPKTGKYKGIFIEAARYICETIKVKCVFKEFAWATFIAGLQSRQIDLSIASTYSKMTRALVVNFSRPLYLLGYKAAVKKGDTRFKTQEDLNNPNITIGATAGTGDLEWVKKVAPKAKLSIVKTEEGTMLQLVAGKVDISVADSFIVDRALETQSSIEPALGGRIYSKNMVAWAVNKKDLDILFFINTAINQLISSGKLMELANKYNAPWKNDLAF